MLTLEPEEEEVEGSSRRSFLRAGIEGRGDNCEILSEIDEVSIASIAKGSEST